MLKSHLQSRLDCEAVIPAAEEVRQALGPDFLRSLGYKGVQGQLGQLPRTYYKEKPKEFSSVADPLAALHKALVTICSHFL